MKKLLIFVVLFFMGFAAMADSPLYTSDVVTDSLIIKVQSVTLPPSGEVYGKIQNKSKKKVVITFVGSPLAVSCNFVDRDGKKINFVKIPAHASLQLKKGGIHIQVNGLNNIYKPGATIYMEATLNDNRILVLRPVVVD